MNSKLIIRVLLCSTFMAGSGTILQSCIFDQAPEHCSPVKSPPERHACQKTTPTVRRVAATSNQPAFARSENGSGGIPALVAAWAALLAVVLHPAAATQVEATQVAVGIQIVA